MESRSAETPATASLLTPHRWTALAQKGPARSKGGWTVFCRAWKAARHVYTLVFCSGWRGEAGAQQELQAAGPDPTVVSTQLVEAGFTSGRFRWGK